MRQVLQTLGRQCYNAGLPGWLGKGKAADQSLRDGSCVFADGPVYRCNVRIGFLAAANDDGHTNYSIRDAHSGTPYGGRCDAAANAGQNGRGPGRLSKILTKRHKPLRSAR